MSAPAFGTEGTCATALGLTPRCSALRRDEAEQSAHHSCWGRGLHGASRTSSSSQATRGLAEAWTSSRGGQFLQVRSAARPPAISCMRRAGSTVLGTNSLRSHVTAGQGRPARHLIRAPRRQRGSAFDLPLVGARQTVGDMRLAVVDAIAVVLRGGDDRGLTAPRQSPHNRPASRALTRHDARRIPVQHHCGLGCLGPRGPRKLRGRRISRSGEGGPR
jgi:hypothetical protein